MQEKPSSLTDQELLALFAEEESRHSAFNLIVRKHQQRLYWMVRRMVVDHDDTNDLVQNIWLKVWQNLLTFKGESELFSWLYRIATNETFNYLDKKKRKKVFRLDDFEFAETNRAEATMDLDGDAITLKLENAIQSLPDKQKLVFQMRYYDEMPYEEMSSVVGTSVGALKASYHHALKKVEEFITRAD